MSSRNRLAYVVILLGFLDGRMATYLAYNGLPFPPEIVIPSKKPRQKRRYV